MVLWVISQTWPAAKIRAFLFCSFLLVCPLQMGMLYLVFGQPALDGFQLGVIMIPAVVIGSVIGLPFGKRLPREKVKKMAYVILLLIGARMIFM